jgi:NAD(P)-dependent dehydrogenase (short-subunit alcohol dehydrogenase family)
VPEQTPASGQAPTNPAPTNPAPTNPAPTSPAPSSQAPASDLPKALSGRVALVAGATRGAGRAIAVELARSGAYVYATGRSSRQTGPSEIDRPETIEETGEMMVAAAGPEAGLALRVDHLDPDQVAELVAKISAEHSRLDVLVNDIFGGDRYMEWDKKLWEHDLAGGLRMLRMGIDTHLITATKAIPLMLAGIQSGASDCGLIVEMTDGTSEYNKNYRQGVGFYYDLVKAAVERITISLTAELAGTACTAVAVTPGWLRSEAMLENFGTTESTWREAIAKEPHFCISESPTYVGRGIASLAADDELARYAGRVLTSHDLAKAYGVTDTDGSQPDCWRYVTEVQDTGKPATEVGYR